MNIESVIRLDDFLKTSGLTATGGQAKILIQSGQVMVNGVVETRRRKQLSPGDIVEALGESFEVVEGTADEFEFEDQSDSEDGNAHS